MAKGQRKPTKPTQKRVPSTVWRPKFLAALEKTGIVMIAARRAGVNRDTVYQHRKADPEFAAAWDAAHYSGREKRLDVAESSLDRAVREGEGWAISLTLRTLGKGRGYFEKSELEHSGRIVNAMEQLTDAELDRFLADLDAKRAAREARGGGGEADPGSPGGAA